jgi:hypothetical protein
MRAIALLAVLLVVGFLVYRQLGPVATPGHDSGSSAAGVETPAVPTTANDLQRFDREMNDFVRDAAADRERTMREREGR